MNDFIKDKPFWLDFGDKNCNLAKIVKMYIIHWLYRSQNGNLLWKPIQKRKITKDPKMYGKSFSKLFQQAWTTNKNRYYLNKKTISNSWLNNRKNGLKFDNSWMVSYNSFFLQR